MGRSAESPRCGCRSCQPGPQLLRCHLEPPPPSGQASRAHLSRATRDGPRRCEATAPCGTVEDPHRRGTEPVLGPSSFEALGTTFGSTAVVVILVLAWPAPGRTHQEPLRECFLAASAAPTGSAFRFGRKAAFALCMESRSVRARLLGLGAGAALRPPRGTLDVTANEPARVQRQEWRVFVRRRRRRFRTATMSSGRSGSLFSDCPGCLGERVADRTDDNRRRQRE
jgi:hypothetical protein